MRLLPAAWLLRYPKPFASEVAAAKRSPNGQVYRLAGKFSPDEKVPAEAVGGVWMVDPVGEIVAGFRPNLSYEAKRWPGEAADWSGWGLLAVLRFITLMTALILTYASLLLKHIAFSLYGLFAAMIVWDAVISFLLLMASFPIRFRVAFALISLTSIYGQHHVVVWFFNK